MVPDEAIEQEGSGESNDQSIKRKVEDLDEHLLYSLKHPRLIKTETIPLPKKPKVEFKNKVIQKGQGDKAKSKIKHKLQFF